MAYRYAYIELQTSGSTKIFMPIDFVGEGLLENGLYTYSLFIDEEGNLDLAFREEG